MSGFYKSPFGGEFQFNDAVVVTFVFPSARGRLVQVRRGVGEFGSDLYLIRSGDGKLASYENVRIERDENPTDDCEIDSESQEYTIRNKFPETGFIIDSPHQPPSPSRCFAITLTKATVKHG